MMTFVFIQALLYNFGILKMRGAIMCHTLVRLTAITKP